MALSFGELLDSIPDLFDDEEMAYALIVDVLQYAAGQSDQDIESMAQKAINLYDTKHVFNFRRLP